MLHVQNSTNTARASSRDMLDMHLPGPQTVPSPLTKPAPTSSNQVPENMAGLPQDIAQMVADLVYESVDRDVLLPYPLHSTIYANAFQDFLTQSTLWQNENFEAQTSRSPPS
ncbi:testis-expressed sequence 22 protein [Sigmodon hispidus]